jgi:hypothetical protein
VTEQKNNIRKGTIYKRRNNIHREKQYTKERVNYKRRNNIQGRVTPTIGQGPRGSKQEEQRSTTVPTRTIPKKGITRR